MKILVINSGSSSIKFELFDMPSERREAKGLLQRIGEPESRLTCTVGGVQHDLQEPITDHEAGLKRIVQVLTDPRRGGIDDVSRIGAVGHRVVHGGEAFSETVVIDDAVERAIEENCALAPLHNPPNLMGIRVAKALFPGVPQVAVFDTAFHQSMPEHAYLYPIPYDLYQTLKVRRYGFHGTSHRFVTTQAAAMLERPVEDTHLITCHLGNGCSMAAVHGGRSIDTTMGLTPLEGLMMGTRSGDIDPAIISFLHGARKLAVGEIDKLLNKQSGLLGVSGVSNDVRSLLEAEAEGSARARLALDMYCYRVRKYIGAYSAALGTVHAVVFTAGVGENSPVIRARILQGLGPLGYELDEAKNARAVGVQADVATPASPHRILVVPTNEELLIARDTYRLAGR